MEPKFRAMKRGTKEFVYGDLVTMRIPIPGLEQYKPPFIINQDGFWEVDAITVGQYQAANKDRVFYTGDVLFKDGHWAMVVDHRRVFPLDAVQRTSSKGIAIDDFDFSCWTLSPKTIHDTPEDLDENKDKIIAAMNSHYETSKIIHEFCNMLCSSCFASEECFAKINGYPREWTIKKV